jgi:hypothetical protein
LDKKRDASRIGIANQRRPLPTTWKCQKYDRPEDIERSKESDTMRLQLPIALALSLLLQHGALAQNPTSDVGKAAKDTGHATTKATEKTAHGTSNAVKDTSHATGHAVKKTGNGVKKGVQGAGHGVKKGATKTADAVK